MMKRLPGVLRLIRKKPFSKMTERELIQLESEIGRELFGPIDKGCRREFFNTSPEVWIWHEEWKDEAGKVQQLTTKYEVRADGVWKLQPGPRYFQLHGDELKNFHAATQLYYERVMRDVYGLSPDTYRTASTLSPQA